MRLALMFFVSDNHYQKKVKYANNINGNNNNNNDISNFYYFVKKRLSHNTTTICTSIANSNDWHDVQHAISCVLLPLTSYKDGV